MSGPAQEKASKRQGANGEGDATISPLRFLSGGVEFAVTCAAGALVGQWIDGRLHTAPWFTVVLLVAAFATATWLLLRALSVSDADTDEPTGGSAK